MPLHGVWPSGRRGDTPGSAESPAGVTPSPEHTRTTPLPCPALLPPPLPSWHWHPVPRWVRAHVQVFIFGGAYISGSVSLGVYAGEPMVATGNVVLVEVQYRVGVLGYVQLS